MADILETANNHGSLSIKDLLEARDLYYYHLLNKVNVVGTAIGRRLVLTTDPVNDQKTRARGSEAIGTSKKKVPRTMADSEVRRYS
jgi:hypothetical protein